MGKLNYFIQLNNKIEKLLRNAEFLGGGHNGIVYLIPNKRIIKIFKDKKTCKKEYNILRKTKNSKFFPKVYSHGDYYIIRDFVKGERLDYFIKKNGFSKEIGINIIKLVNEFKRLGFNKLDIRCKDLYVGQDFKLMVIDPKNNYAKHMNYPRHLMKGLYNLGVLEEFLLVIKEENLDLYDYWNCKIKLYLEKGIK